MSLKACPFCGSVENLRIEEDFPYTHNPNIRRWWVQCYTCDAVGPGALSESAAIVKWNERPGEDAAREEGWDWGYDAAPTP
jgi:Lar family restriction alleviation protein